MRFAIEVEDCCGRWRLVRTELLAENLSRTHVECAGCGQRRTLTVTNLPARTGLEVVA